jgi:cell wall-associated NlpC family hydrolase
VLGAALVVLHCGRPETPPDDTLDLLPPPAEAMPAVDLACPAQVPAPHPLPGVADRHRTLAFWLEQTAHIADLDEVLLDDEAIAAFNAGLANSDIPLVRYDLGDDPSALRSSVEDRLAYVNDRFESATYVQRDGSAVDASWREQMTTPSGWAGAGTIHVTTAPAQVRCAPLDASFYTPTLDLRFDRNNCSTLDAQEPVQLLGAWPNGMRLVRGTYTLGWLPPEAPLSPALDAEVAFAVLHAPRVRPVRETQTHGVTLTPDTEVPRADATNAWVATPEGMRLWALSSEAVEPVAGPLTRRALLTEAFRHLDEPYGWGGQDGGRDCSRFVMDTFERFGIGLPRFSAHQAAAGSFVIDVEGVESEQEKLLLIDAAARRGAVLLHFPGHIMFYLGRDDSGRPMALHSFAEYLEVCEEPPLDPERAPETLREVDRVTVSDLELGRGTSRTAFIERITKITVIGGTPGPELRGAASYRSASRARAASDGECPNDPRVFTITTPRQPNARQSLAVLGTSSEELGPLRATFIDPDGVVYEPEVETWGTGPFTWYAELPEPPRTGAWEVWLGDGGRVADCQRVDVRARRPEASSGTGAVWTNRNRWSEDMENLYASFVERLFAYPIDEDLTWTSLHELVRNADLNVLYDYYGQQEDEALRLEPDCADLPYMLRAYFAWKVGLPFGFRACSRGRAGRPPTCRDLATNLEDRTTADDVAAFDAFARRRIRNGVHSASGRTAPDDDETDYYPVALTREALRPGTLYADPYGHLLIIAGWIPQGVGNYGILVGADAQPDGTVGRRRFWRGSFLFSPDTTDVGAGFKAFRPVVVEQGVPRTLTNRELRDAPGFAPYSLVQYEGSTDAFYDRMEAIINPRPLDPLALLGTLVDALEESVSRRVNSVDNGERFMAGRGPIDMPTGYAIFETSGPWEDFSTPSRDMRLLISIDTVVQFPARVRASPERYGIAADGVEAAVAEVEALLARELAAREFSYTRTDGSSQSLRLADVVERAPRFEMAYNPNDCPEVRWAAAPDSEEMATCRRRAPAAQAERMRSYRPWFTERQRPPR